MEYVVNHHQSEIESNIKILLTKSKQKLSKYKLRAIMNENDYDLSKSISEMLKALTEIKCYLAVGRLYNKNKKY